MWYTEQYAPNNDGEWSWKVLYYGNNFSGVWCDMICGSEENTWCLRTLSNIMGMTDFHSFFIIEGASLTSDGLTNRLRPTWNILSGTWSGMLSPRMSCIRPIYLFSIGHQSICFYKQIISWHCRNMGGKYILSYRKFGTNICHNFCSFIRNKTRFYICS